MESQGVKVRTTKRKQTTVTPFQVCHNSKRAKPSMPHTRQTPDTALVNLAIPNPVFPSFRTSKPQYDRINTGKPTAQDLADYQSFIDSWYS